MVDSIIKPVEEKETALRNVYISLLNEKKVKSQADFARKLKYTPVAVSEMIRALKPIPFNILKTAYDKYGVNANYLVSEGKDGPMYIKDLVTVDSLNDPDAPYNLKEVVQQLRSENDFLKKVIADKEKIIDFLEKKKQ